MTVVLSKTENASSERMSAVAEGATHTSRMKKRIMKESLFFIDTHTMPVQIWVSV